MTTLPSNSYHNCPLLSDCPGSICPWMDVNPDVLNSTMKKTKELFALIQNSDSVRICATDKYLPWWNSAIFAQCYSSSLGLSIVSNSNGNVKLVSKGDTPLGYYPICKCDSKGDSIGHSDTCKYICSMFVVSN